MRINLGCREIRMSKQLFQTFNSYVMIQHCRSKRMSQHMRTFFFNEQTLARFVLTISLTFAGCILSPLSERKNAGEEASTLASLNLRYSRSVFLSSSPNGTILCLFPLPVILISEFTKLTSQSSRFTSSDSRIPVS